MLCLNGVPLRLIKVGLSKLCKVSHGTPTKSGGMQKGVTLSSTIYEYGRTNGVSREICCTGSDSNVSFILPVFQGQFSYSTLPTDTGPSQSGMPDLIAMDAPPPPPPPPQIEGVHKDGVFDWSTFKLKDGSDNGL